MAEWKPCKCGNKNLMLITKKIRMNIWFSLIACMAGYCNNYIVVSRYGFSKSHAEKRAIEAWNKKMDGSK